jgi:hypothetical protein
MKELPLKQVDSKSGGHNADKKAVSCNYKQNRSNGTGIHRLPDVGTRHVFIVIVVVITIIIIIILKALYVPFH